MKHFSGGSKPKRSVETNLLAGREIIPSRESALLSRDSVMTSRDSVMTSRDSVMTSRDSVMTSREATSTHDAALASALLQQQQVLRQQFLLAHYQQLSALQTPLVHQILQPQVCSENSLCFCI